MYTDHKARVILTLAEQYPPAWQIPPYAQWFALPERMLIKFFDMGSLPITAIQPMRILWNDRLADIESGEYYDRPALGVESAHGTSAPYLGLTSYHNGANSPATRFNLDRCEATWMVWWLDVVLNIQEL